MINCECLFLIQLPYNTLFIGHQIRNLHVVTKAPNANESPY